MKNTEKGQKKLSKLNYSVSELKTAPIRAKSKIEIAKEETRELEDESV